MPGSRHPDLSVPLLDLPVGRAVEAIAEALDDPGMLVLIAEPGAGKSTLVPIIATKSSHGRVVLLQPRRLAARATAARIAELLGEEVGGTVGLTIRGKRRVGRRTQIEVVTEAVLTNRFLADPDLPGIACVIFDEFHERNLHADLGLGMAIEARAHLRPDLRIVVMSATIDTAPIAALLGGAPVVKVPGRSHEVVTTHRYRPPRHQWTDELARTTIEAIDSHAGDALVFVPGRPEVDRLAEAIEGRVAADVRTLHGGTPAPHQRVLLRPAPDRRLIVATAVAETSVTVPGVRIVVDGGLARRPRFDPISGLGRLETVFVPRFGADQRRGRAGRDAAGICVRLWSVDDERHLAEAFEPEIVAGDPLPAAMALCLWGDPDATDLPLLDRPSQYRLDAARRMLEQLRLVDGLGRPTELGRAAGRLPVHPRSAAALLAAAGTEAGDDVITSIATVEEDVRIPSADLRDELTRPTPSVVRSSSRLRRHVRDLSSYAARPPPATLAEALVDAWPDRVAIARPGSRTRFQLASGPEVEVPDRSPLAGSPFLVVATAGASGDRLVVRAAVATDRRTILARLGAHVTSVDHIEWDDRGDRVVAVREQRLASIVLHQEPLAEPAGDQLRSALHRAIRKEGLVALSWTDFGTRLRARLAWLHTQDPDAWPDVSDRALLDRLDEWLDIGDVRSPSEITVDDGLRRLVDRRQQSRLDRLAPETLQPPRGRSRPIDYASGRPRWAVRIQQLFGLDRHPVVGPQRTPIVIELLTPADRPAQVTTDLPGFWRGSYAAVRAELRGRYPRHDWPEDPLSE